MKTLLVDDNPISQKTHKQMLENFTSQIDVASNAREAFRLFEQTDYELALIDVGLPDISGIEVAKLFKTHKNNISIMMMTACLTKDVESNCVNAGIHILPKPIDLNLFREQTQKNFSEGKMKKENIITFTLREKECAHQIIDGRSPGQIAKALNLNKCTVYFYLTNVNRKLELSLNNLQKNSNESSSL